MFDHDTHILPPSSYAPVATGEPEEEAYCLRPEPFYDTEVEKWFAVVEIGRSEFFAFPDPSLPANELAQRPPRSASGFNTRAEAETCCARLAAMTEDQLKVLVPEFFEEDPNAPDRRNDVSDVGAVPTLN